MKRIFQLYIAVLCAMFAWSCEDELVDKVQVDPSSIQGGEFDDFLFGILTLSYENANTTIAPIKWKATDYGFATSVTYSLQISPDASFNTREVLATTSSLQAAINIETLNNILVKKFNLPPGEPATLKLRVVSSISGNFPDVISPTEDITIVPYDPNIPPIYLVGDGQGWNFDRAVVLQSIAPLRYAGFVELAEGDVFRLFEKNSWDDTGTVWGYSFFTGTLPAEFGDNGDGDSNFVFTSDAAGTYEVIVDLNQRSITIKKQLFPQKLFIIGDDQGWSLDDANAMLHRGGGVFVTYERLTQNNSWRFFESPSWGANQWNFNTFSSGTIDDDLSGTTEGDANFRFVGATGIYKITVSTLDLTITIEPAATPTMYLVGGDNSWTFGDSMTWIRGWKFETTITLTAGNEWRFFPEKDNWGSTFDYRSFSTIDGALWTGPNGGDANFLNQVSGTYKITMDAGGGGTLSGVKL